MNTTRSLSENLQNSISLLLLAKVIDGGLELLKAGLAWHYSYFDKSQSYQKAHQEARRMNLGLWADEAPVNPFDYRNSK